MNAPQMAINPVASSASDFDIERARLDTPGCHEVLHLNNAGAALVPVPVLRAQMNYLALEARRGAYEAAEESREELTRVYESAAVLLNCEVDEIAILESSTRAWQVAFHAIPLGPGDRIVTGFSEYGSNYIALLQVANRTGARIDIVPNDEFGRLDIDVLRARLKKDVKVIAVTHIPTDDGLINRVEEVGKVASESGAIFILDACQSLGQLPIDVKAIGCDILSAAGRKYLRGPRGSALLYVRRSLLPALNPTFLDLTAVEWCARDEYRIRPDARRFENWETSYAAKIGLGAAIDYALAWGIDTTSARISSLATCMRSALQTIPGVVVRDGGVDKSGLVTFTVDNLPSVLVRQSLMGLRIHVSDWHADYARLGMEVRGLRSIVRASVHYYNTTEEIDRFCSAVADLARNTSGLDSSAW
jgi:selenocysteine lyase/cysteine desulfurase